MVTGVSSVNNYYFDTSSIADNRTEAEDRVQRVLGNNIDDYEKIVLHLVEASSKKVNPIALAFQKNDFVLAEQLFKIPELEHPGYEFRCHYNQGEYPVWIKPILIRTLNDWGVEVYKLGHNRVDLEAVKLLVKYDSKKNWKSYLGDWLIQSYQVADLETIATLYPLAKEFRQHEQANQNWQKISVFFHGGYRFITDPFLSNFPVRDSGVPMHTPRLYEYRKDDNALVREYKKQIQEMLWGPQIP